jgi:hypothetical protein
MFIRMSTTSAGPAGVRVAGSVHELPDKEAKELIAGGYAVEVKRETLAERATAKPARERATAKSTEE